MLSYFLVKQTLQERFQLDWVRLGSTGVRRSIGKPGRCTVDYCSLSDTSFRTSRIYISLQVSIIIHPRLQMPASAAYPIREGFPVSSVAVLARSTGSTIDRREILSSLN